MADIKELKEKLAALSEEQVQQISGGGVCSVDELQKLTESLIDIYEDLVDFTSHVIERVAGP